MSELRIVTPEEVRAAGGLSDERKRLIVAMVNNELMGGEVGFICPKNEAEFVAVLAGKSGWSHHFEEDERFAPRVKIILAPNAAA